KWREAPLVRRRDTRLRRRCPAVVLRFRKRASTAGSAGRRRRTGLPTGDDRRQIDEESRRRRRHAYETDERNGERGVQRDRERQSEHPARHYGRSATHRAIPRLSAMPAAWATSQPRSLI